MKSSLIDHIVVTAPDLQAGSQFIQNCLGVVPQVGGSHPGMGTHNMLLRLGDMIYLEVIAVDPRLPDPGRIRWFNLDNYGPEAEPTLNSWVVRSENIYGSLKRIQESIGSVETMSRGDLRWLITIPGDGRIPLDGTAPAIIQWETDSHPAVHLVDHGLSLVRFEIYSPQVERIAVFLESIDFYGPVSFHDQAIGSTPCLKAYIKTPRGIRLLSTYGE